MPILGGLLVSLFTGLGGLFSAIFGAQIAVKLAAVAAFVGFGVVLLGVFNTLVAPIAAAVFSTSFGQVLGLAFPPIAGTCLAAVSAVWAACGLYGIQRRALSMVAG
jgi:Family of unknown function (DUF5455)